MHTELTILAKLDIATKSKYGPKESMYLMCIRNYYTHDNSILRNRTYLVEFEKDIIDLYWSEPEPSNFEIVGREIILKEQVPKIVLNIELNVLRKLVPIETNINSYFKHYDACGFHTAHTYCDIRDIDNVIKKEQFNIEEYMNNKSFLADILCLSFELEYDLGYKRFIDFLNNEIDYYKVYYLKHISCYEIVGKPFETLLLLYEITLKSENREENLGTRVNNLKLLLEKKKV